MLQFYFCVATVGFLWETNSDSLPKTRLSTSTDSESKIQPKLDPGESSPLQKPMLFIIVELCLIFPVPQFLFTYGFEHLSSCYIVLGIEKIITVHKYNMTVDNGLHND